MKKKYGKNFIHIVIASVAVINLCLLVFFGYGLSDETPAVHAAKRAAAERAAQSGNPDAASAENNAAASSAASAEDANAEDGDAAGSEDGASAEAEGTDNSDAASEDADKDASSDASAAETESPVITLSDNLPEVTAEDLDKLAEIFRDLGYISADDGYGNDISEQITASYEESSSEPGSYNVTFSVTNQAGRTATETCTLAVNSGDSPVLKLTSEQISLSVGSEFNFLRYLEAATDVDGSPLDDRISISGVVDTSTPGSYDIVYSTSSRVTGERVSKTLTVVVS